MPNVSIKHILKETSNFSFYSKVTRRFLLTTTLKVPGKGQVLKKESMMIDDSKPLWFGHI